MTRPSRRRALPHFVLRGGGGNPIPALPTVGTAPGVVYGYTRLVTGYAGKCCRVVRASDSATQDLDFVGNIVDVGTAVSFAAGSALTVDIFYDQSGNARDALQTTANNRPTFSPTNAWRGVQGMTFNSFVATSGGTQVRKFMTIPAGVTADRQNVTTLMVTAPRAGYNKNAHMELGTDTVTRALFYSDVGNTGNIVHRGSGSAPVTVVGDRFARSNPSVNGYRGAAGGYTMYLDDRVITGLTAGTAGALAGGLIGSSVSALFDFRGEGFAYVVYPAALSDADVNLVRTALQNAYGYATATSQTTQLTFEGDSITEGASDTLLKNNMRLTYELLNKDVHLYNMAVHGTTWATENARRVAKWGSFARAGVTKKIAVMGLGSNDMIAGVAATVWATDALPYMQYVMGQGWTLVMNTVLPRGDISAAQYDQLLAFNNLIRVNAAAQGYYVADYNANPAFNTQASASNATNFFTDTIHPRTAGYQIMAPILAAVLNPLI